MKKTKWLSCLLTGALLLGNLQVGSMTGQAAGNNVAQGKSVQVSGLEVQDGRWTGELAVDGIRDTEESRWSAPKMKESGATESSPQTAQWLELDLQAETTQVETIKVYFYRKVWATSYRIQTRASRNDTWEDVGTPVSKNSNNTDMDVEDTITDVSTLKRYVRFYFEKVNVNAGGNSVSVREIEIIGTQSAVLPPQIHSAQEAANQMGEPGEIAVSHTQVPLPEVAEGFSVQVIGSDVPGVITDDGRITAHNIGNREVNLILEVRNESDKTDTATRKAVVTVPDKTGEDPQLYPSVSAPNQEPAVLPSLQEWYGYEGQVVIDDSSRILYADKAQVGLEDVAAQMREDLREICGITPPIVEVSDASDVGETDIYLESQRSDLYETGEEGYFLVADEGIRIYSSTKTGALYGTVTVEQILWQDAGHTFVPKGVIRDYPNYEIRGLMFDVGRIPHRLQYLEDYTKILKWYKMNEFHLHLNDNYWSEGESGRSGDPEDWENVEAAHRLESDTFPSLVPHTKTGEQYDYYNEVYTEPFYTKEEYIELQKLAMSQGIQVLSEIDTPCHSAAYTRYAYENPDDIEWLGPIQNPGCFDLISINTESSDQTERENAVRGRQFMEALLEEYIQEDDPVFLGDTVHIGTDEYDFKAGNYEAFRSYINDISGIVKEHGKKVRMWGALSVFPGNTEVAKDIVLDEWATYEDDPIARMKEGYSVVNVPQPYLYTTPGRWHKDMINEQYIYDTWDPTIFNASGGKIADKGEPKLLGAKAAIWGDEQREGIIEADLHERALRAAAMVSEKTWGGTNEDQTFTQYEQKLDRLREGPGTQIAMTVESESDLVLDYPFDQAVSKDGIIQVADASGNGYDGTANGGTLVVKDGETLLKLDGTGVLETPLTSLRYPYTVSFDVAVDEHNPAGAVLFDGYDGRLSFLDREGTLGINRSFYQQELGYRLPEGQVHTVTVVGTYQTTKIYIDGEFTNMLYSTDSGSLTGDFFTSFVFPMERVGEGFTGYLGNIRVYRKALTPKELAASSKKQVNVALNCPAYQENGNASYNTDDLRLHPAWKATDGDGRMEGVEGVHTDPRSYWNSSDRDTDSLMVDFKTEREISSVEIQWVLGKAADSYDLEFSLDGEVWSKEVQVTGNSQITTLDTLDVPVRARYLRMQGAKRLGADYGIQEIKAYELVDKTELGAAVREAKRRISSGVVDTALEQAYTRGRQAFGNVCASGEEASQALAELKVAMPDYTAECICNIDSVQFASRQIPVYTDREGKVQGTEIPLEATANVTDTCHVEAHKAQSPVFTYEILEGSQLGEIVDGNRLAVRNTGSIKVRVTVSYAGAESVTKNAVFKAYVPKYRQVTGLTAVADSEQNSGSDGPGSNAVDGNEATIWHSNYSDTSQMPDLAAGIRNGITFDLGQEMEIGKLVYVPRQSGNNGRILEYRLLYSASEDGDDFAEIPGGSGTWADDGSAKTAEFTPVTARRIRLEAIHTGGDTKDKFISAAEVYLYEKMTKAQEPPKETVTVEYLAGEGGRIEGSAVQTIEMGGSTREVLAVANAGYVFSRWSDGSMAARRQDSHVTESKKITAIFTKIPVQHSQPEASGVKLDKKSLTIGVKEKVTLKAKVLPSGVSQKVTWSSSNQKVAIVNQKGRITGKKTGKAVITAQTANGKKMTCKVTVKKAPKKITLQAKKKTMKVGKTLKLKVIFTKKETSYQRIFKSSKPKVVSVSAKGKIKAKKKGTATITVRTFNNKKAAVKITVK